jgi:hypothetical protein
VLVARRFVFFDFNLKAEALISAALCAGLAYEAAKNGGTVLCLSNLRFSHPDHSGLPEAPPGVEEDRNHTRLLYCLPLGIAMCYPRSVNRNIFYIIGVIVVIVIVLKVLHVF